MWSRRTDLFRRAGRWLWPAATLVLAPKCLLCALAYAGLGTALGIGGPEICGGATGWPGTWPPALIWFGFAGGLGTFGLVVSCRRARSTSTVMTDHD